MSVDYDDWLNEQLKDPEFRAEYEAVEAEEALVQVVAEARASSGLTPEELSERTGIKQSDIIGVENGQVDPSLSMLNRLALAMNMKLRLELVPASA